LLSSDALNELCLDGHPFLLIPDMPGAVALASALRANSTLTSLSFRTTGFWIGDGPAAATATLLAALTAHRSLRVLVLSGYGVVPACQAAAGAVLGALVAANAPALEVLSLFDSYVGDGALRPLCDALPANTHLRALDIGNADIRPADLIPEGISAAFARDVLLPSVRANTSLRQLKAQVHARWPETHPAAVFLEQATALVAARTNAAAV
jgi:hypothetical protein